MNISTNEVLKSNVDHTKNEKGFTLQIQNPSKRTTNHAFSRFGNILEEASRLSKYESNTEGFDSALYMTMKHIFGVCKLGFMDENEIEELKNIYDFDFIDVELYEQLYENFEHYEGISGVKTQTFTLSKFKNKLEISYKEGVFEANEETISIQPYSVDYSKYITLKHCGKGVTEIHYPYKPHFSQKWRHNTSSQIAISFENKDGKLFIGIESNIKEPFWYQLYDFFSTYGSPYSNVTLDLNKQTEYTKNRSEEELRRLNDS